MNKKILIIIVLIIVVIAGSFGAYELFFKRKDNSVVSKQLYTCPMHPQIISDHPGQCPICGMDLILKTDNKKNEITESRDSSLAGISEVRLSPSQQVLANVQTEKVKVKTFSGEKVFNGYVKINDKNFSHLSSPVSGRIEKMYVSFEGQYVRKGEPIFEIYSPELVSTQKEYLLALDNYDRIKQSDNKFAIEQAGGLVNSSKDRLSYWEFTPSQFDRIESSREILKTIAIHARYSGYIAKRFVNVGHWAMAGEDIYDIADLSTVWVIANIYESDVQLIKTGQTAEIISTSYPDEPITAKINYINPVFNPDSRTMEVRIDVANTNNRLKPDMYVKIKINTFAGQWVAVPKNSVIKTGDRSIVYVEKEKGVYVPRSVQIGSEHDGYYAVSSGLNEGETVVSSGGFLIDSETEIETAGSTQQHDMSKMNNNSEEKLKINKDQDIMKDMDMKK